MDATRHEKIQEALREVAAEFMAREANRNTLVTVTRAALNGDGHRATVYITALPESEEEAALAFANRNIDEVKKFFKERVRGAMPPYLTFEIDRGEKNRQRLDELSG